MKKGEVYVKTLKEEKPVPTHRNSSRQSRVLQGHQQERYLFRRAVSEVGEEQKS